MSKQAVVNVGLEGVVVTETRLSEIDGQKGRLILRGVPVADLAGQVGFEEGCYLLWNGRLPESEEAKRFRSRLGQAREWAYRQLREHSPSVGKKDGMDALRASIAQLELPVAKESWDGEILLVGAMAVVAAAWCRQRSGQPWVAPDPERGHAEDCLRMVLGAAPPAALSRALDSYLVTVMDHGMNASTFACRVVASTGSDLVSSVVAGIGALKGPLHGGAPGPVLDMLDGIGGPARAREWLSAELDSGRRIMGFGHRVYRVRDPRAAVLERAVRKLEESGAGRGRLELAGVVEQEAETELRRRKPDRPLRANVEFYTAVLLEALGLPREMFSPTFAVARAAGWCAHVAEQRQNGRLIRPSSRYVGPRPASESDGLV